MKCIFCDIINKKIPASIVYEDERSMAFMDIYPITKGHTLVIPKTHFITLDDCDDETARHLITVVKKLNPVVCESVRCEGILNEVMNGEAAGQEIFHLHFHIVPRYKNDGFGWIYPKDYGYREKSTEREILNEIAGRIRDNL